MSRKLEPSERARLAKVVAQVARPLLSASHAGDIAQAVYDAIELSPASIEDAMSVLQGDYNEDICSMAMEAIELGRKGELDEDGLHDWLHESIDGHERVIHTFKAKLVGILSDNADAYFEETGEPLPKENYFEVLAYYAMMADVRERIDAEGEFPTAEDENEAEDEAEEEKGGAE